MRSRSPTSSRLVLPVSACLAAPLCAQADDFGLVIQASTDTIYHGTTETFGEPSIGINAQWQPDENLFVGIEAHTSQVDGVRQRHSSYGAYVGTAWELDDNWLVNVAVQHREFPGAPKEWASTELKAEITNKKGFALRLDYSPDYYSHDTEAFVAEIGQQRFVTDQAFYSWKAGAVHLSNDRFFDYQFAEIGAGFAHRRYTVSLAYGWNSEDGRDLFGAEPVRSPRLFAQLAYRLY
ncbi:MAG: hypothetical protein AAFZ58_02505 [Pseudomonadota bacterium]